MICKNCGATLKVVNGKYHCDFCSRDYPIDELESQVKVEPSDSFVVQGGVLRLYKGNSENVAIPQGVVVIGEGVFRNNIQIKNVRFSSSVLKIDKQAFQGCTNLQTLIDYESVEDFGEEAFRGSGLSTITIGQNVKTIGKYCFADMPNLEKIVYCPNKIIKHDHTFLNCSKLVEVEKDQFYFFPSLVATIQLRNNPTNKRPTLGDAFRKTPYLTNTINEYMESYKKGICPECGGKISKGLFHAKCKNCGVDYKN